MTAVSLTVLFPVVAGPMVWWGTGAADAAVRRRAAGALTVGALVVTAALGLAVAVTGGAATYDVGAGIALQLSAVDPVAGVAVVLVPTIAACVAAYAAAHEPVDGLGRLLGLLTVFVGAMELLVVAADLATLTVAFELVGGLSWALIGHRWRDPAAPRGGAHAFNATRAGGLGLFLAAGAAFAGTGSFAFDRLAGLDATSLGVVAGGVLLAALAKSAQVPFAPWLFSAMEGPTPVSALLHSSTMVAAGAYVLIRLQPVLERIDWFPGVVIGTGLVTAVAGGVVGVLQRQAKHLLAASTSAQYGLMLVAVGAGFPAVAALHLVVHAFLKAQLFLTAGLAISAVGSEDLGRMRVGSHLRSTAVLAAVGSLALAAVPPMGGAFSKEEVVAAAAHEAAWLGVLVAAAGGLSAAYATRFQLLAFGRHRGDDPSPRQVVHRPGTGELAAVGVLAVVTAALAVLWLPVVAHGVEDLLAGTFPSGAAWELILSAALVALGVYAVWAADRSGRLGAVPRSAPAAASADWLGLGGATRRAVVDPTLRLAAGLAVFDDRVVARSVRGAAAVAAATARGLAWAAEPRVDRLVAVVAGVGTRLAAWSARTGERLVDGAVAGTAWLVDRAAGDARELQTGLVHHQYVVIAAGLVVVVLAAAFGR